MIKGTRGFSLVEALLAGALFAIIAMGLLTALTYSSENAAVTGVIVRATDYAEEGLEAARSIRDSGFTNLTVGTFGVVTTSNRWALSGSSDTFGNFTRSVSVTSTSANIKTVTSSVQWSYGLRSGTINLATTLTNWITAVFSSSNLLIYGDGTVIPKYRTYTSSTNSFGSETDTVSGSVGVTYVLRTSPTSSEAIAGYVTAGGVLQVMCFDGSNWTNEWSATVGGTGSTRRFDIAYETSSGDVIVLYSTNVGASNELAYRTKSGTLGCGSANWTSASNYNTARTSGVVQWVKLAWDKRTSSDLIAAAWADNNSDLSAAIWNGSAFVNEPATASETSLEVISTAQDVDDFDIEFESLSGDVMMVWANSAGRNGTNGVRYNVCTGGIAFCTWGTVTTPPTFSDDATNLDISSNPISNEIVFASIGNGGNDLQIGYWNGTAWTNTANADTSCNSPAVGTKLVATGWVTLGGTSRSIVRYADQGSSALDWYSGNGGSFTKESDFRQSPAPSSPQYYIIDSSYLNQNMLMSLVSDSNNDLFAKRLVMTAGPTFTWTNADAAVLQANLPQSGNSPFSFAFKRYAQ